jgi:hypothetical protein
MFQFAHFQQYYMYYVPPRVICWGTRVLHSIILIELTSEFAVTVLVPNCRIKYGINVVTL